MKTELQAAHDLVAREDWPRAWPLVNRLLNEHPENPQILFLAGSALRGMGMIGLALTVMTKCLAQEQARKQVNVWMTYAATLHDLNRWEEAEKGFLVAHGMVPGDAMPLANIGATYIQRGLWRDALNWCDRALAIDPENHIARISKGFGCLSLGRWQDAWKYAEALYGNHLNVRLYGSPDEPEWDGTKGQTVVVQCDQGLGDQCMFAQCIPQLQADCKLVIIECSKRMEPFFKRNFPGTHVYGTLKDKHCGWVDDYQIDAHIHISLLGKFYRKLDKDFPRKAYITARPETKTKWLEWLSQFPRPWIGVSWKGGIQATQKHLRSMNLTDFGPILALPGTFIDLSYMDNGLEISQWNIDHETQVVRPPIDTADYEDTIALLDALDEVATVTTSIVHFCGALGRSCHVLVPEVAQWRYAYRYGDGSQMVWYPDAVKLYRQKAGEVGWEHAVSRVARALRQQVKKAA